MEQNLKMSGNCAVCIVAEKCSFEQEHCLLRHLALRETLLLTDVYVLCTLLICSVVDWKVQNGKSKI